MAIYSYMIGLNRVFFRYHTRVKIDVGGEFPKFQSALEKALSNLRDIGVIKEEEFDFELNDLKIMEIGSKSFHYSEGIISKRQ